MMASTTSARGRLRSHKSAGIAAHSTMSKVRLVMPTSDAACATPSMPITASPGAAQGNPVIRWPRSHSTMAMAIARSRRRDRPSRQTKDRRRDCNAPVKRHAAGQRSDREGHHPQIGAGIDRERPPRPSRGRPRNSRAPNAHPVTKAGSGRRCGNPSISQTRTGNAMKSAGHRSSGGNASPASAPAPSARKTAASRGGSGRNAASRIIAGL